MWYDKITKWNACLATLYVHVNITLLASTSYNPTSIWIGCIFYASHNLLQLIYMMARVSMAERKHAKEMLQTGRSKLLKYYLFYVLPCVI